MESGDLELGDVNMVQDTFQSLLDCIENEVNHMNVVFPPIDWVPHTLRDLSPSSFTPRVVSIGPLHREDDNVRSFEKEKLIYLNNLMCRTGSPLKETLKLCVDKAYSSMDQIKACYVWAKTYSNDEIAKMMVVDACFILEFIYNCSTSPHHDAYGGNRLLPRSVVFDLVLLENQIPLFFLDEIYSCTISRSLPHVSFITFICRVLKELDPFMNDINIRDISINSTPHILSLLHECYNPQNYVVTNLGSSKIFSATDLDSAGVNFEPDSNSKLRTQMRLKLNRFPCGPCSFGFWIKPTLRMPVLLLHDFTEVVLRNLIAYEQLFKTHSYITSYAFAMNILVKSEEDVAKLQHSGILINSMGSNEEVANMINKICKNVELREWYYDRECVVLNMYCETYIAWVRRTYFRSPWSSISLLAGIVLFFLTVLQTIFTIKPVGSNN